MAERDPIGELCADFRSRIRDLEAALVKYGQHQFWHCDSLKILTDDNGNAIETRLPCTCGFTVVRATASGSGDANG